jgi:hypothetical protein
MGLATATLTFTFSHQFLVTEAKVQSQVILVDREALDPVLAQVLWFSPLNFISPLLHVQGGWGPPRAVEPVIITTTTTTTTTTPCAHSFICYRFYIVQILGQHSFFMVGQILVFRFLMGNCNWPLVKAAAGGNKSFMNPLFLYCIINMLIMFI